MGVTSKIEETVTVQQPQVDLPTQSAGEAAVPSQGSLQITENDVHTSRDAEIVSPRRSKAQLTVIMTMLYFSVFLAALDTTITTTALPTITQHFSSSAGYTWVGSSYLLATAAAAPTWGKFSDIWGRKPALLAALAVFFLGSLIGGISSSMAMLIAGRTIQGTGGGGILTLVNICTSDLFSVRNRGLAFGLESLIWASAAAVGPVLGGAFSELASWRWCFYVTLVFLALVLFLKLETPRTPIIAGLKAVDWLGSIAIVGATITLLLGLEFGGVIFPWSSAKVLCLITFSVVMVVLFLVNESKFARHPVMPLHLFSGRPSIAALLFTFFHGLTYFSASYYLPLYAQAVKGYGPLQSGYFVIPFEISLSISCAISGILVHVTGRYLEFIWLGISLMVLTFGLFIRIDSDSTTLEVSFLQIIAGIGTGTCYTSPLIAFQALVSAKDTAVATSTWGFIRNLSAAISVVIGGVVFQNGMASQENFLSEQLGNSIAMQMSGKFAAANILTLQNLPEMQRDVAKSAYAASLKEIWIAFTCTAALALFVSLFITRTSLSKIHQETHLGLHKDEVSVEAGTELRMRNNTSIPRS